MSEARYGNPLPLGERGGLPYSKGVMARALIAAGVPIGPAYELARRVELELVERREWALDVQRFEALAVEVLGEADGLQAVGRLRRYAALQALDLPIVMLIGGATGTGKSTVATEAAHRLGITRVTSTDFIRQTLREFFSPEAMPSVHYSSFETGGLGVVNSELGDPAIAGFLDQTRNVLVGVEGAVDRALTEGWSMVLEGVHLVPGMVNPRDDDAVVIQVVLRMDLPEVHVQRFHIRDASSGGVRAMDKYIAHLEQIRAIQDHIVSCAELAEVPVIESSNLSRATAEVMELALSAADRLGVA